MQKIQQKASGPGETAGRRRKVEVGAPLLSNEKYNVIANNVVNYFCLSSKTKQ